MGVARRLGLDVTRRDALVEQVQATVALDPRVQAVQVIGSLKAGKADEFSDIDMAATLRPGTNDREFFFDLPELMAPIGPNVAGWGFASLPDVYVATFNFLDYPLFWQVDIRCDSDTHIDGSDLIEVYRWEQIYKMWIGAAKYSARAMTKLDDIRTLVTRHAPLHEVQSSTADELRALLEAIRQRKIAKGDPYEVMHRLCEGLLGGFDD